MSDQLLPIPADTRGDVEIVAQALAALAAIESKINDSDDLGELHDIADQAALLIEMQRIRNLSADLALAALRVSVLAWRRIGQLGANVGTQAERTAARTLARLSVTEVDEFLADFTGRSASGLAKIVAARLRERDAVDDIKNGNAPEPSPRIHTGERARGDIFRLHQAAQEILRVIELRSGDVTTASAAIELLSALDLPADPLTVQAARQVVMEAMTAPEPFEGVDRRNHLKYLPRFVTYLTDAGEWLRIPAAVATVSQVRWMADYRRDQARDLTNRALELDRAATELERASVDPDTDLVRMHWARASTLRGAVSA